MDMLCAHLFECELRTDKLLPKKQQKNQTVEYFSRINDEA